jgi:hypothetical protein
MGPSLAVEGATTARVFETYVEKVLAPSLKEGQIVVMDNLGAHKPKRIGELIEERGCELLYLPAYSPDFNPIEEAFSKIKTFLQGRGQEQGGSSGSVGHGALRDQWRRSPRLLQACRVPSDRSTTVKRAVRRPISTISERYLPEFSAGGRVVDGSTEACHATLSVRPADGSTSCCLMNSPSVSRVTETQSVLARFVQ